MNEITIFSILNCKLVNKSNYNTGTSVNTKIKVSVINKNI